MPERELPEEIRMQNGEIQELSPEILEMIMNKVQDINRYGVAFHRIGGTSSNDELNRVKFVLKDGLLGRSRGSKDAKSWASAVRKKKATAEIYVNITGRFKSVLYGEDQDGNEIEVLSPPTIENAQFGHNQAITVLFDISSFKEIEPMEGNEDEVARKLPAHSFVVNQFDKPNRYEVNEKGETVSLKSSLGFELKARVAPRFFSGIILGSESRQDVQSIVSIMLKVDKDKPERILPVYDVKGNLLWPKKMDYEEVKSLVKEK